MPFTSSTTWRCSRVSQILKVGAILADAALADVNREARLQLEQQNLAGFLAIDELAVHARFFRAVERDPVDDRAPRAVLIRHRAGAFGAVSRAHGGPPRALSPQRARCRRCALWRTPT